MIYRGKDTLAKALMDGLLEKPRAKIEFPEPENLAEAVAKYEASLVKPAVKIDAVADALTPKKAAWRQKLDEENLEEANKLNKAKKNAVAMTKGQGMDSTYFADVAARSVDKANSTLGKRGDILKTANKLFSNFKPELQAARKQSRQDVSSVADVHSRRGKKQFKEDVETLEEKVKRLEEISSDLAKQYSIKARQSISDARQGRKDVFMQGLGKSEKAKEKLMGKWNDHTKTIDKRQKGLSNASDRIREDVESLEEVSKQTLQSYQDKAFKSKINAHVDLGAAKFNNDKGAIQKSSETIGKRDRGLETAKRLLNKIKDR